MTLKPAPSRETNMSQYEETFRSFAVDSPNVLSRIDSETLWSELCKENATSLK